MSDEIQVLWFGGFILTGFGWVLVRALLIPFRPFNATWGQWVRDRRNGWPVEAGLLVVWAMIIGGLFWTR